VGKIPTLTPLGIRLRATPRKSPNERSAARNSASSTAISTAALAIGCPWSLARSGLTVAAVTSRHSRGRRWWVMTCCAPSTYSGE